MLIGIDASRTTAAERTGTENYSLFLLRSLLELDRSNRYRFYFDRAPAPGLIPAQPNLETRPMPFPRLWTHLRLSAEMATHPPRVLFVPSHVLPLVHPPRCVATVHDLGYLYYPQAHTPLARRYLRWSTAYNASSAAHVIADSEATRRDLVRHCGTSPNKVTVVYPGRDPAFVPVRDAGEINSVLARYQITSPYVLYVGTLHPRKNLALVLDAVAGLARRGVDVHWVIAGKKGWQYELLFARVRELGLETRVHFVGYVPTSDLPALLSGASAFVLPSLYEGFGFPVLEAMACGTPVLCSNVSSLPEVAGDAALLLDPRDVSQWANALSRVMEDQMLRRDLVERGFRQVARFSWEGCAKAILEILERVGGK